MASLVQKTTSYTTGSSGSASLTGVTGGNTVIIVVDVGTTSNPSFVTPSGWTQLDSTQVVPSGTGAVAVYAKYFSSSGTASATLSWTGSFNASWVIAEFSGLVTSAWEDTSVRGSASGTFSSAPQTISVTSGTPSSDNVLFLAWVATERLPSSVGGGFTEIAQSGNGTAQLEVQYAIPGVASAQTPTTTYASASGFKYLYRVIGLNIAVAPSNTVAPVITGTAAVGETLSATTGTWTANPTATYSYQWQRDNYGGGTYSNIASATSATYKLTSADEACNIRCVVTATNLSGSVSANSNVLGTAVPNAQLVVEIAFDADPTATYKDTVLNLSPVGYWRMDASSGTTETDVGSGGHNGTYVNSPTLNATGALPGDTDKAVTFNGTTQGMSTTYVPVAGDIAEFSLAAWVKVASAPAAQSWVAGAGAQMVIATSGKATMSFWNGSSFPGTSTASSVCDGSYHLLVGTWDGTTLSIYVDGVLSNSSTPGSTPATNTSTFNVAAFIPTTSQYLAGSVDEVAWFAGKCLSARQVGDLWRAKDVNVNPTWTDVSTDVLTCKTKFGRVYEIGPSQTGTANLTLDNTSRDYDPTNANSPYYPNVIPLRPIRISAIYQGSTYRLWTGYIERWPQTYEGEGWAEVDITCVDGLDALSAAYIIGTFGNDRSDQAVSAALSAANWSNSARSVPVNGSSNVTTSTFAASNNESALTYIQLVTTSEAGNFYCDQNGNAVFEGRTYRTTGARLTSQATFGDEDTELEYLTLVPSYDRDHIINHWDITGPSNNTQSAEDSDSIRKYWRRSSLANVLLDDSDALALAQYLVGLTRDPGFRIDSMVVEPLNNATIWTTVLGLNISDRITVVRRPPGGGTEISIQCFIESIQWNMPGDLQAWQWQVQLSPVPGESYLILDDATKGTLDSGNLLGF